MAGESITCSDCGEAFVFGAAERAFYDAKGLVAPKRCKVCRATRRSGAARASSPPQSYAAPGTNGTRSDRPRWDARCTGCGARALVPFEPRPGRDVFCSRCWRDRRDTGSLERSAMDALDRDATAVGDVSDGSGALAIVE